MKTLVLGSNGQLGRALADTVPEAVEFMGFARHVLDITNADALMDVCLETGSDIIINAAAYTAVDKAESEVELANAINVDGSRNVAAAANTIGARLIHVSTDFVFDGDASTPYKADAPTNPISVYGKTKQKSEQVVLDSMPNAAVVVRTAWLYSKTGGNFVKTMLRLMDERNELGVVADQVGTPTWADSLAKVIWGFVTAPECSGIFHWADGGQCSWCEFAVAIQEEALSLGLLKRKIPIQAISTEDYPTAAARPRYSVLDCSSTCAALDLKQTEWRANLRRMLKGILT